MQKRTAAGGLLVVAVAAIVAVVSLGTDAAAQLRRPVGPTPTPVADPPATRVPFAEQRSQTEADYREGRITYASGTQTAGTRIRIDGRDVQLPPDAYVERFIQDGLCAPGRPCPEAPIYILRRGNSTISISMNSGKVNQESLAPGEASAFDFLNGVVHR
jgi:hypothetical protein